MISKTYKKGSLLTKAISERMILRWVRRTLKWKVKVLLF